MAKVDHSKLKGIIPSFLTPLTTSDFLDVEGAKREVDYLLAAGSKAIWIGGTGGEIHAIAEDVLYDMVKVVSAQAGNRALLIANISACGTQISVNRSKIFADMGVSVAAATPPFYFSYTSDQVLDYYKELSDKSSLPIIIYNNPYVGNKFDVNPELVAEFTLNENIIGIKDCSGHGGRIASLIKTREKMRRSDFLIYESWEPFVLKSLTEGADGAIMSAATVLPNICQSLYESFIKDNLKEAEHLQNKINKFLESFMVGGVFPDELFIGGTKACLELLGICSRLTAHPLRPWPKEKEDTFREMLCENNLLNL